MDFYLILALGPRNGLGYCVVNQHKVKGEIIIIIIIRRKLCTNSVKMIKAKFYITCNFYSYFSR